ncbi:hypothetical protein K2X85_13760 [bacterium]|nr:hypothetical protein [bacterium]
MRKRIALVFGFILFAIAGICLWAIVRRDRVPTDVKARIDSGWTVYTIRTGSAGENADFIEYRHRLAGEIVSQSASGSWFNALPTHVSFIFQQGDLYYTKRFAFRHPNFDNRMPHQRISEFIAQEAPLFIPPVAPSWGGDTKMKLAPATQVEFLPVKDNAIPFGSWVPVFRYKQPSDPAETVVEVRAIGRPIRPRKNSP